MNAQKVRVTCRLRLEFPSHEEAQRVHRSVALDNDGYLDSRVEDRAIVADIRAESLNSLLHTLDDFLSCTSVAEGIVSRKRHSE